MGSEGDSFGNRAGAAATAVGTAVTTGVTIAGLAENIISPYLAAQEIAAPADEDTAIVAQAEDNTSAASALYTLDQWAGDQLEYQLENDNENNLMDAAERVSEDIDVVADFPTSQEIDPGEPGDFGDLSETEGVGDFGDVANVAGDFGGDMGGDMGGEGGM